MIKAKEAKYWDAPLNFMTGCTKVSPGCDNCWARSAHEARRKGLLKVIAEWENKSEFHKSYVACPKPLPNMYLKPFSEIQLFHDKLSKSIPGGKPKTYFVNNTADTFHPDVPDSFIAAVLNKCSTAYPHRFLWLTKRPERMCQFFTSWDIDPARNIWIGLTICNQPEANKNIIHLLRTAAVNRWLSLEPLLSEIDINKFLLPGFKDVQGIFRDDWKLSGKWVVIGCESGKNRRPCKLDWVYSIVDQCQNAGVKVFVKQLNLDGKCEHRIERFPKDLQTRELPWKPTND